MISCGLNNLFDQVKDIPPQPCKFTMRPMDQLGRSQQIDTLTFLASAPSLHPSLLGGILIHLVALSEQ